MWIVVNIACSQGNAPRPHSTYSKYFSFSHCSFSPMEVSSSYKFNWIVKVHKLNEWKSNEITIEHGIANQTMKRNAKKLDRCVTRTYPLLWHCVLQRMSHRHSKYYFISLFRLHYSLLFINSWAKNNGQRKTFACYICSVGHKLYCVVICVKER